MNYETFENRYKEGIYKKEDKFWVCDVRPNDENPVADYRRKLKPTQVIVLEKEDNSLYFVKPRKDGKPSKTTVSITGPVLYAVPFNVFETQWEAESYYKKKLKEYFMDVNRQFDGFKATCEVVLGGILNELKEMEGV